MEDRSSRRRKKTASRTCSAFRSKARRQPPFISAYSVDPTWSPDGRFVIYSGPDVGTKFAVKAATAESVEHPLPELVLTRGARHLALLPGGRSWCSCRARFSTRISGWSILRRAQMQQLTHMPAEFDVRDFDLSADGAEAILERAQARSTSL